MVAVSACQHSKKKHESELRLANTLSVRSRSKGFDMHSSVCSKVTRGGRREMGKGPERKQTI